ncbi:MAG TPA: hypothetical protein VGH28_24835 [Polyangiaceae bacterium]
MVVVVAAKLAFERLRDVTDRASDFLKARFDRTIELVGLQAVEGFLQIVDAGLESLLDFFARRGAVGCALCGAEKEADSFFQILDRTLFFGRGRRVFLFAFVHDDPDHDTIAA